MLLRSLNRLLFSGVIARSLGLSDCVCPCCGNALRLQTFCRTEATAAGAHVNHGAEAEDSTKETSAELVPTTRTVSKPKVSVTDRYLTSNVDLNALIKAHRQTLTFGRVAPPEMYTVLETLAESVAKHMELSAGDDSVFMEGNPGLGLVTQAALERGVSRIRVFEGNPLFLPRLQSLQKEFGSERLDLVCPFNIFSFKQRSVKQAKKSAIGMNSLYPPIPPSKTLPAVLPEFRPPVSETWQEKLERLVSAGLPKADWTRLAPAVKFFGIVPEKSDMIFIKRLVKCVANRDLFCTLGRPVFYLIVAPAQYQCIMLQPSPDTPFRYYRFASVAVQTLFEIDTLEDVPRGKIVPPPTKTSKSPANWKLIKLSVRRNLDDVLGPAIMPEYLFFINQAMMMRTKPLLGWLDGWIPGSAQRLMDIGYTMYQRTGDIGYAQYVEIFKILYFSPEYPSSNLKMAFISHGGRLNSESGEFDGEDSDANNSLAAA